MLFVTFCICCHHQHSQKRILPLNLFCWIFTISGMKRGVAFFLCKSNKHTHKECKQFSFFAFRFSLLGIVIRDWIKETKKEKKKKEIEEQLKKIRQNIENWEMRKTTTFENSFRLNSLNSNYSFFFTNAFEKRLWHAHVDNAQINK